MHTTEDHDESRQGEALVLDNNSELKGKKLYIESYGCAMNFADSEVVASILAKDGFQTTSIAEDADVILLNTCSIRENAENRIKKRLFDFKKQKQNIFIIFPNGCGKKNAPFSEEKIKIAHSFHCTITFFWHNGYQLFCFQ